MPHAYERKLGALAYVMGGLAYFPLIGIVIGAAAIIWGTVTRKQEGRALARIGAGGVAFNCVFVAGWLYFGARESDEARALLTRRTITSLTYAIEFHKAQTGHYPEDLHALKQAMPQEQSSILLDPMGRAMGDRGRAFHYKLIGTDHYVLRSIGADGKLYTRDDILPNVEIAAHSEVGLVIEPKARWTAGQ